MARDEKEKYIIKKALAYFNEEVSDEELDNEGVEPNSNAQVNPFLVSQAPVRHSIYNANLFLHDAFMKALSEFDWSFFIEQLRLAEICNNKYIVNDEMIMKETSNYGFKYTFKILDDIYRLIRVQKGSSREKCVFVKRRDVIATNYRNIECYGIVKKNLDEYEEIPSDFYLLVAQQLAFMIQPIVAPQNPQLANIILSLYRLNLESLIKKDCQDNTNRVYDETIEDV